MKKALGWLATVAILGGVGVLALIFLKSPAGGTSIDIGFNTWVGYGPLYIAKEKGYFDEENLRVNLQRMEGTGERRAALAAGRLQAVGSTIDDLIMIASQNIPAGMVLAIDESAGADGILVSDKIGSVQDLKGKRIGVQPGFVNHFFLLYILKQNNIKPSEVTTVPLEPDKAAAAFAAHELDVAVTWEPHLSEVKKARPDGKVLLTTKDFPGVIVDILVFRKDFIEKQPAAVHGFVRAWYRAVQYLQESPAEGQEIIAKALSLKREEVADMLTGVHFFGMQDNAAYYTKAKVTNIYRIAEATAKLWKEAGFITAIPSVDRYIDDQFFTGASK